MFSRHVSWPPRPAHSSVETWSWKHFYGHSPSAQSDQSLRYPVNAQRRLWSGWADAQADLSLRWAHTHFVGFVMRRLILHTSWRCSFHGLWKQIGGKCRGIVIQIRDGYNQIITSDGITTGVCSSVMIIEPRHEKTIFSHIRTTKVHISLRIRAVWSAPLLLAS